MVTIHLLHIGVATLLPWFVSAVRVVRQQTQKGAEAQGNLPCPALSAMFKSGHFKVDSGGRATQQDLSKAIEDAIGGTKALGLMLSGAAKFAEDDIHQLNPLPREAKETKVVNVFTLRAADQCSRSKTTPDGYPCNANTQVFQHSFSTNLFQGQPDGGFEEFFVKSGALIQLDADAGGERALTIQGIGHMLRYIRFQHGDYSGQYALNSTGGLEGSNMARYHPSITKKANYQPLSQWEATLSWSAFFVAFSQDYAGTRAITETSLRSFVMEGKFPEGWKPRVTTIQESLKTLTQLKGMGVADELIPHVEGWLAKLGPDASEFSYAGAFGQAVKSWGAGADRVLNRLPEMLEDDA